MTPVEAVRGRPRVVKRTDQPPSRWHYGEWGFECPSLYVLGTSGWTWFLTWELAIRAAVRCATDCNWEGK